MSVSLGPKSKALLQKEGWIVEKCEHWNAFSKTRHDLHNFGDLVCIREDHDKPLLVQVTSIDHVSHRRRKLEANPARKAILAAYSCEIHGWVLKDRRWQVKREVL